ncbi:DUF2993 domain-containing protein [Leifsonia sp. H3M29-4]|uniref:LmeA family phospholipid-binding protein n=1 Tax=Salinibacterium metalliresistens TaxID=3031321 RepID=UPI0023DB4FB7|nr:DUF2993 domain-containing protein [Salinibacterium metalliresistens]MDF1479969.1 DUF2993 domain-containing protein [Salinibacterium metalliresistens]
MAESKQPAAVEPVETSVVEFVETPRKKRRLGWIIALAIVVVVLVAGFFVADAIVRQIATGYVRDRIVSVLALDPATPIDVDLGSGSILLQAAGGSLDELSVHADAITLGEITGEVELTATKVPLDAGTPLSTLGVTVTVTEQNVRKLASFLSASELKSIDLRDGMVRVGTEFDLIFFTLPVSVDLLPSAVQGGIAFDPQTILLGDQEISVQDLRDSPEFSAFAGDLLASRDFCVAGYLPAALTIADVDVIGSDLVVVINGDGIALGDPALAAVGTCPGEG